MLVKLYIWPLDQPQRPANGSATLTIPPSAEGYSSAAVCRDLFPWSIKSAPPAIPFDTPVTGMVAGEAPQQITTTYSPYLSILQTVTSSDHDKFSCTYHMRLLQWRSDSLQKKTTYPAYSIHLSLICLIALLVCHFTIQMLSADHFHLDTALVPE